MRRSERAPGLVVGDGVVLPDSAQIGANVVIHAGTVVGEGCVIQDAAVLGKAPALARTSTADRTAPPPLELGAGAVVCCRRGRVRRREHRRAARSSATRRTCASGRWSARARSSAVAARSTTTCTIGARVRVQTACYLTAHSVVEDDVFVGPGASTTNDDTMSRHAPAYRLRGATLRRACRIGGCAVLCPGVEVGEEAFVAAGAVVTARRRRRGRSSWACPRGSCARSPTRIS